MRPGQNRRVRGRNRNKGPNPLTRAFESNGPDVKIRGTAQHVADKYAQLARDAQASGDPVSAENYLQHAEHYYRLIAAAQEQLRQQFPGTYGRQFDEDGEEGDEDGMAPNGYGYPSGGAGSGDEFGDGGYPGQSPGYEGRNGGDNRFSNEGRQSPVEPPRQVADRPNGNSAPRYDNRQPERPPQQQRFDRNGERFDRNGGGANNGERVDRNGTGERYDRNQAPQSGDRNDRGEPRADQRRERFAQNPSQNRDGARREYNRNDRPQGDRPQGERSQGDRSQGERMQGERPNGDRAPERFGRERPVAAPRGDYAGDDAGREDPTGAALPAFLTTPVRPPVSSSDEQGPENGAASSAYAGDPDAAPFEEAEAARPRRRRTRRPIGNGGPDDAVAAATEPSVD